MKKILFILFMSFTMALMFQSTAYATQITTPDTGGNADNGATGDGGKYNNFQDGVSEDNSGWILYVVDKDGKNKSGTKLWYSYNAPTTNQYEGQANKKIDVHTRLGNLKPNLKGTDYKTNAPWGPPVWTHSNGPWATNDDEHGRGRAVKNWFVTGDNLEATITKLWGADFYNEFIDNEYVLVLEPIFWLQMHMKDSNGNFTPIGIYGYGTARGFARIMKEYAYINIGGKNVKIFGDNGCDAFHRYTNNYYPNCVKFEKEQFGIPVLNKGGRLTHDEIINYAYGIMTVWAREAGTGPIDPTPSDPDNTTKPTVPSKVEVEAYTYNYSDQFNLDKNNDPAGRIPSGEQLTNGILVDSWRVNFKPLINQKTETYTASYQIEIEDTSMHEVKISAGRWDEFKDSYPNLRIENGYLYNGSIPLTEQKVTTEYHWYDYSVDVDKSYRYYYLAGMQAVDLLDFSYAEITNDCFYKNAEGNPVVVHKDNKTFKDIEYTQGRGVIQTPTNQYNILLRGYSTVEEGQAAARNRASSDVGSYVCEGDTLIVNGVTFLTGNNYKDPTKYEYPKTEIEVDVTIPFDTKNGHYPTSAKYVYINHTKDRNEHIKKEASTTTIEERIRPGYTQNEPVFVHTPVVSPVTLHNTESATQLVPSKINSDYVDYQLILEHTYSFTFDMGKHLDLMGYSQGGNVKDFSKYVKKAEVSFPFDVAIVDNSTGTNMYSYYKANEWIEVNYRDETFFYIPTYAIETDYGEIYYRVWAYNSEGENAEEALANTGYTNYVAYYKTAVQLSGIIYNFQVVGIADDRMTDYYLNDVNDKTERWMRVFPYCPNKEERKWGNLNRVGTPWLRYTKDSTITNSWNPRYLLPYSCFKGKMYGQWDYSTFTMATGTTFTFSVETIANLWDENIDSIEITPTFRYVDTEGNVDTDILLYTSSVTTSYIPWGGEKETTYDVDLTHEGFMDSYNKEQVLYTMQKYNEVNGTNYIYPSNFLYTREMKASYTASKIVLNSNLRLLTGHVEELEKNLAREGASLIQLDDDAVITLDEETKDRFNYSMQTWFGMYTVPSEEEFHVVRRKDLAGYTDMDDDGDVDLYDYMYAQELGGISGYGQDEIFQHEGYLVIGFDIVTINNGEEHLTYHGGLLDMCQVQGIEEKVYVSNPKNQNPYETEIIVESGDVAVVDLSKDLTDRRVGVGIMIIN